MMKALLLGLAEGMRDAFTLAFQLVLTLTLAYFLLPHRSVSFVFDYLHALMRSDQAGTGWVLMCVGCLGLKVTADVVWRFFRTKETK